MLLLMCLIYKLFCRYFYAKKNYSMYEDRYSHGLKHPLLNLLSESTNVTVYKVSLQKSVVSNYAKETYRYQENIHFHSQ